MRLLLVRHGPAADRRAWGAAGKDDALRPLTEEGEERTRRAFRGLARLLDGPYRVVTSPHVRAVRTAELLGAVLGAGTPGRVPGLAPGGEPGRLLRWLEGREDEEGLALVGHEPLLGALGSLLLAGPAVGERGPSRPFLQLRKAGACLLETGDPPRAGEARLAWLLAPGQLRRLGR